MSFSLFRTLIRQSKAKINYHSLVKSYSNNGHPISVQPKCMFSVDCSENVQQSTRDSLANADEVDKLYKMIELEIQGHDSQVLNSYETFTVMIANELGIELKQKWEPWRVIEKRILLRSIHIFKKHREYYERRTYFKIMQFQHLTGSTADTFLEYIERNLPEGVAMIVKKHQIEALPSHLKPPTEEDGTKTSSSFSSSPSSSSSSSDSDEEKVK